MTVTSPDVAVIVVGSGIAGRMAAIHASARAPVLLVTDGPLDRCNSIVAQGGIHAPREGPSGSASMVADIMQSARVPLDRDVVSRFVQGAADVTTLLQRWGLKFDREEDGSLRRRLAGGMSEPRVLTSGDQIGVPLLRVLGHRLEAADVTVRTHTRVVDVRSANGHADVITAEGDALRCRAVVIASGGSAYRHAETRGGRSTNPRNGNHLLYELLTGYGAATRHDEYWQFQPFGLVDGPMGPPGRCVPETVAALGPRLLDRNGRTVCELPVDRLRLTEAMWAAADQAIEGKQGRGFLLTLSDVDEELLRRTYPKLTRTLEKMGGVNADVLVWPFLHYQLGGLATDASGATSLSRVFAAGEVVGGLHGRNRLMGLGITDALVRGWRAGAGAARCAAVSQRLT